MDLSGVTQQVSGRAPVSVSVHWFLPEACALQGQLCPLQEETLGLVIGKGLHCHHLPFPCSLGLTGSGSFSRHCKRCLLPSRSPAAQSDVVINWHLR